MGCVYLATNLVNGKLYVGKTTQKLATRISQHITHNVSTRIHQAIIKYGAENFKWEILYENDSDALLYEKETFFIITLGIIAPYGYNVVVKDGGVGKDAHGRPPRAVYCVEVDKRYPSIRLAMMDLKIDDTTIRYSLTHPRYCRAKYHFCDDNEVSITQLKEEYLRGFPRPVIIVPEERRRRISSALKKTKKLTPEAAQALQKASLGYYASLSPEDRQVIKDKISITKSIPVKNLGTGTLYPISTVAAKGFSIARTGASLIRRCCRGELRTAYGYHWEFVCKGVAA